jgi:antitoxin (DNA-binding transcriptional repressor) of toxin-antitoxin stability system
MKTVAVGKSDLSACVDRAQRDRVVVLRNHKPVALIVGVEGLDREQLDLGSRDGFWRLIESRRKEKTISRGELERRVKRRFRARGK